MPISDKPITGMYQATKQDVSFRIRVMSVIPSHRFGYSVDILEDSHGGSELTLSYTLGEAEWLYMNKHYGLQLLNGFSL